MAKAIRRVLPIHAALVSLLCAKQLLRENGRIAALKGVEIQTVLTNFLPITKKLRKLSRSRVCSGAAQKEAIIVERVWRNLWLMACVSHRAGQQNSLKRSAFAVVSGLVLAGCMSQAGAFPPSAILEPEPVMADRNLQTATGAITLTGVRETKGDAVDCPKLRTDDGVLHPVSFLPADVAIGDRVSVSGRYGVTTTCTGQVLIIADLKRL